MLDRVFKGDSPLPFSSSSSFQDGPFVWGKDMQGHVLGAFFYGYLVSQVILIPK